MCTADSRLPPRGQRRLRVQQVLAVWAHEDAHCLLAGRWVTTAEESTLLVEQDWGLFEGSGIDEAAKKYPDEWKRAQEIAKHQGTCMMSTHVMHTHMLHTHMLHALTTCTCRAHVRTCNGFTS